MVWLDAPPEPSPQPLRGMDYWRVLRRGLPVGILCFGGLAILLLVRLIERPLFGLARPVTPYITQGVCRATMWVLGFDYVTRGRVMAHPGAIVANHCSWLDIFTLNAAKRIYFVAKAEVHGWPGIGWLARATGTVFVERQRSQSARQRDLFEARLQAGHKLLFFPEGTSTDGMRVLPFKPTLFAAFFSEAIAHDMYIQPVSVNYTPPEGEDALYYGWWGDMDFGPNLLKVLAAPKQGAAEVVYHAPLRVDSFANRKSLASAAEDAVRSGHHNSR